MTVVYNAQDDLETTIRSVLEQDYPHFEYLIVDGGSQDGTVAVIERWAADDRLRWISEPDQGIYDAMNKGLRIARGEWINFMNAGDGFVSKGTLGQVAAVLDDKASIAFGNHIVDYGGRTRFAAAGSVSRLWMGSQFCHQAVFVRTDYHRMQEYCCDWKLAADFHFFLKSSQEGVVFKNLGIPVAKITAGGASDVFRGRVVDEWRRIAEKEMGGAFVNVYYRLLMLRVRVVGVVKRLMAVSSAAIRTLLGEHGRKIH